MDAGRLKRHSGGVATTPISTRREDPLAGVTENAASLLAALERSEVDAADVARVAALIDFAPALDDAVTATGRAGLGSIVKVADRRGRSSEYELIGPVGQEAARQQVTLASPVGQALLGARPGDYVHITLHNGRRRRVRVTDVVGRPGAFDASAAAA